MNVSSNSARLEPDRGDKPLAEYHKTAQGFSLAFLVGGFIASRTLYGLALGLGLLPSVLLGYSFVLQFQDRVLTGLVLGSLALPFLYFLFGFTLIAVVPLLNWALGLSLPAERAELRGIAATQWYLHNTLQYVVRYSFMHLLELSPFNNLFLRLMGMKIGRNVIINSSNISDPSVLIFEDDVTIGGSATVMGHYGSNHALVVAPVILRRGSSIGASAVVLGDVEVGEGARVLPNSLLLPGTRIPKGETWGGVPAKKLSLR